jgi:hypothetical protein
MLTVEGDAVVRRNPRSHAPLNENTRVAPFVGRVRGLGVDRRDAWAALDSVHAEREHALWRDLLERLHTWRAERLDEHALAVVVKTRSEHGPTLALTVASAVDGPAAIVVGRHELCDAHLRADAASLRHACCLVWPSADGGARAVAIDLASSEGLRTPRATARRISAPHALSFWAHDAEVFVLAAARDRPFAVRTREEIEAHVTGALIDDADRRPVATTNAVHESTRFERSLVVRMARELVQPDTLVLAVDVRALARGVVLGRDARCRRSAALMDESVSRVHALVFAADDALWIVDTASTGGTSLVTPTTHVELCEGHRIARIPDDARVQLAGIDVALDLARAP